MGSSLSSWLSRSRVRAAFAWRVCAILLVVSLLADSGGLVAPSARAQTFFGATLTILRGTAAVLRADGTPISPAANGLTLAAGDQVATVGRASALVTFFEGSELELGADTTIIIRDLSKEGQVNTIGIESVVGTTINRVVALTNSASSYKIDAGGTVALVRGTVFAHHVDPVGDITVAVGEGVVDYPSPGSPLRPGQKRTVTARGDIMDDRFDPATPLINTVVQPVTSSNPIGTDNPGLGTGSVAVSQQQQQVNEPEHQQPKPQNVSSPGHTFLLVAVSAGTVRLEVPSNDGFAIGDLIRISDGTHSEIGTIVGFGSIILQNPLTNSYEAGSTIDVVGHTTPTPTPTPTVAPSGTNVPSPTVTATGTAIPTATGTLTPTATVMRTASPTAVPTQTTTSTPTATGTATATSTLTPTATATSTVTATNTATATATATPTATATATSTATATATATAVPCNNLTRSGGTAGDTTTHELGQSSGTFDLSYDAQSIPDRFVTIYEGVTIDDTGFVSNTGVRHISYSGTSTQVTIQVIGNSDTRTVWEYTVGCPFVTS